MTTLEVGNRLVELVNAGRAAQAIDELYDSNIVSIEAGSESPECHGIEMCRQKGTWFNEGFETHSVQILGPYPNSDKFAVHLAYDVTHRGTGNRFTMNEIALYQVRDGRIVWEKFYYDAASLGM